MKIEHFKSIYLTKPFYQYQYRRGIVAAELANRDEQFENRFEIYQDIFMRINYRKFDDAAFLMGYANTVNVSNSHIVKTGKRSATIL